MEGKAFLTEDSAYLKLLKYFQEKGHKLVMKQLFQEDPDRFNKYKYMVYNIPHNSIVTITLIIIS